MLLDLSLRELSEELRSKRISATDVMLEALAQIDTYHPQLNSFISTLDRDMALKQAKESDVKRTSNSPILHGIPFSVKDVYVTKTLPTTSASNVLKNFRSPYDATVIRKLSEAGAILIGKNNQDAWGHGGSSENTDYGPVKNPWNTEYVAGGSSGGSAASVSARMIPFSVGEDTGGSIRNPASMCSITGLKVTYGRVSRYGAISYASSLDTVGPLAKSAEDIAILLEIMAGQDPLDGTSSPVVVDQYSKKLTQSIKGKVIGLPKEYFESPGLDSEIKSVLKKAQTDLEKLGVKFVEVSIPSAKYGVPIYYLTALSETSSNLARYDGIRYGQDRSHFSQETLGRIMMGTFSLAAGYAEALYKKGQEARMLLIDEFDSVFQKCDAIMSPVTPSPPSKFGSIINDPVKNLLEDLYTGPVNIVGVPSLALPSGFTSEGLPIGFQLIGKKFSELEILNIGHQYQQVTAWHRELPTILKENHEKA